MTLKIPSDLLPRDGRFGCGPAKVRPEALNALANQGASLMGTSHRQAPVRALVGRVQESLKALYSAPDGYEVVLGNGGATLFWDAATFSLIERLTSHAVFGEFGGKFATAVERTPHLEGAVRTESPVGSSVLPQPVPGADVYAWTHNETSTGARADVVRVAGADEGALMVVDGTSSAGALPFDLAEVDAYYFSPQKTFSSDGGLWLALMSPAAVERIERLTSERWVPAILNLMSAVKNSRAQQTLNTPALATLFLLAEQLDWILDNGGMDFAVARTQDSSRTLYSWAERSDWASPFVSDPNHRSPVVGTIDFYDAIPASEVCSVMRSNGIVDIESYRKLGRNQIRVGMFPSVDPEDVAALTRSLDWVAERVTA